ncbi:MAG: sensor histidine kinase, partial [Solirubrobacteraceae bacterium]
MLFALVMAAFTLGGSIGESHPSQANNGFSHGHQVPVTPWPAYLIVAGAALALICRRRYPMTTLTVALAGALAYTGLGYVNGSVLLAPTVALYAVAVALPWRRAVAAAVVTLLALSSFTAAFNPPAFGRYGGAFDTTPFLVAAALFAGLAVANRRAYVDYARDEEARRRVGAERLRIARELHDVVAHTMATINVQAGVAAHVGADLPPSAVQAFAAIREQSKRGLAELRSILSVLRQADEAESTQPAPTLAEIDTLVASAEASGLNTTVRRVGRPRPLPAPVELAAYRIVQESLTNAIRHAGPAAATLTLDYRDSVLRIEVADTGRGPAGVESNRGGHGLLGMRERAAAVGGMLRAERGTDGGFQV